ncbi:MAG: asparagine synthase-related protein [Clostridiaceae bacterium]
MSAIFGIVNLDGNIIIGDFEKKMIEGFKAYKLDSVKSLYSNNIFFGCGIQYITPESLNEVLPYYDKEAGLIITADAIIDNRGELIDLFNINSCSGEVITDSQLVLMAYKRFGYECPKYLVGDFSFVIWDDKKKEVFCARDHVGSRTFYYYFKGGNFIFSTVEKPIYNSLEKKPELNERWITDFLALPLTLHQCECNDTIYQDIYQLSPACTLVINEKGKVENKYWNPLKEVKPLKLKTDEEYEESFRKVFSEAVKCRLRSTGNIGIMLSGGMDSGSVACLAAKQLSEKNETLKAYSSIPIPEFKNTLPRSRIPDESEYIESIKNLYANIDVNYCRNEGKNSLTDINQLIYILEQPHKIIENLFWYDNIMEIAEKQKCKVMLSGQFGNYTISYGDFLTQEVTLFRKGKLLRMVKEINEFSGIYKISRRKAAKIVFKAISPYRIRKFISTKIIRNNNEFNTNLADKTLADKWKVKNRFEKYGYHTEVNKYYDINETKKFIVDPVVLCQLSSVETKFSLAHGMIERDPTRDKRVIEFCISLPSEQFVRDGNDRYLIRRAMKGILPDKIRLNIFTRGLQSADWIQRLEPVWKEKYMELQPFIDDKNVIKYIDKDKIKNDLIALGNTLEENKVSEIRELIVFLIFSKFIKMYHQ